MIDYQIKKGDKWDLTPDIVNSLIQTSVKSGPYPYESSIDSNPNNIGRALSFGQKPDIRLVTMYFKQGHLSFIQYSIDYSFNQKEAEEEKKTFNAMLKIYLDDKGFSKIGEKEVLKLVHRILKDTKYYVNHKKRELIEVSDKRNYIILEKY